MKNIVKAWKKILVVVLLIAAIFVLTGCSLEGTERMKDTSKTLQIADNLQERQPTPTDINFSLERYNLIRRAYWVNGQREKANAVVCEIQKPLGYVVLITDSGAVVGTFIVDGKITSLNSFLTPDSIYYEYSGSSGTYENEWLADVDGSYGENDVGIFFFTPHGQYVEWNGRYLYSDIPFQVDDPVVSYKVIE